MRGAVNEVSFTLDAGETLGIVGESGSGKTTLALSLLRLLPPAGRIVSGEILFEGEDLLKKSDAEMRHIRGKRIAMILQDPMASLNPLFTIGDQVAEPIRVHEGMRRARTHGPGRATSSRPSDLGAGDARRASIPTRCRAGCASASSARSPSRASRALLIADEPTTSLDVTIQAQYLKLLRDLQRAHNLALIFITHNLGIVAKMCDQVAVMYAGRIVERGPVKQIFNSPAHPYTRGAARVDSAPRRQPQRLTAIDGQPPDLAAPPPGCAFHPRCPKVMERCRAEAPPGSAWPTPAPPLLAGRRDARAGLSDEG